MKHPIQSPSFHRLTHALEKSHDIIKIMTNEAYDQDDLFILSDLLEKSLKEMMEECTTVSDDLTFWQYAYKESANEKIIISQMFKKADKEEQKEDQ